MRLAVLLPAVAGTAVPLAGAMARLAEPCLAGDHPVALVLDITDKGRPSACRVERSSGVAELDAVSCRISLKRLRFTPARDEQRRPIASTYAYTVRWRCPDPAAAPPRSTLGPNGQVLPAARSALDLSRATVPR